MQVQAATAAMLASWPAARALCSGGLWAASQHMQQLWSPRQHSSTCEQQHQQQQRPAAALHSLALGLGLPAQRAAFFHTSSRSCSSSSEQQQRGAASSKEEQQPGHTNSTNTNTTSSSSGANERVNVQQEASKASKGFLAKSLDMEELWFAAVGGKLKVWSARTHPDLKGKEEDVVDLVMDAYYQTLSRAAAGHLLSNRSRNQLKQACLAAATYKVLVDSVPGSAADAEQFIADLMGGLYAPFMLGGLKVSSWVKRLLLRQSSVSQAVDTLHTIARDMEGACHCSVQPLSCGGSDSDADGDAATPAAPAAPAAAAPAPAAAGGASTDQQQQQQQEGAVEPAQEHEREDEAEAKAAAEAAAQHHSQQQWQLGAALTVDTCLYAEVLTAEGVPQLVKSFCCQHNMSWLDTYAKQGVDSHLEACIAKGDACCRITVAPAASGGP